jgi:hypothetical protein
LVQGSNEDLDIRSKLEVDHLMPRHLAGRVFQVDVSIIESEHGEGA